MKKHTSVPAARRAAAALVALALAIPAAHAQFLDLFKWGASGGSGSFELGSLSPGSVGNAAGVIEYCMKNNYLDGANVAPVRDGLVGKMRSGQSSAASESDYLEGTRGVLSASGGYKMSLGGTALKPEFTQKVCVAVLEEAKSML
ncbi:MAG TPA: DUF2501 domain-containing protein [Variovorax sp.]|nr:DUF2501 domain-containing protein [Variovorax sp.]